MTWSTARTPWKSIAMRSLRQRCLMVDDLLATGGTMNACCQLVAGLGGDIVGISFLIELSFLKGRERFGKYDVHSVLQYDRE